MLYGYGSQIWAGTLATCLLTVLTLLFSIIIGMIGALCKLSPNPLLRWPFTAYTTLIRSVPDLVIMLLVFYNLQELINFICAWAGWAQYQMDAFSAGVTTLSFIYGAYMTETFRGAIQSVPKGQLEAGYATGMTPLTVFRLILLPQLIRSSLMLVFIETIAIFLLRQYQVSVKAHQQMISIYLKRADLALIYDNDAPKIQAQLGPEAKQRLVEMIKLMWANGNETVAREREGGGSNATADALRKVMEVVQAQSKDSSKAPEK